MKNLHLSASLVARYLLGLAGTCFGAVLMIRSACGLDAWNAVIARLSELTPISLGLASILVQGSFWLLTCVLNHKWTFSCVIPMVYKGLMLNVAKALLVHFTFGSDFFSRFLVFLIGYTLTGFSTGLYIATGYAKMPIDGLHTALADRFHLSRSMARLTLEGTGLVAALILAGNIGIGTLIITGTVGFVISKTTRLFAVQSTTAPKLSHSDG